MQLVEDLERGMDVSVLVGSCGALLSSDTVDNISRYLPALVWQHIYQGLTQQDICTGMRVCELLKAVLPGILLTATLKTAASMVRLSAVSDGFPNLRFLKLGSLGSPASLTHNAQLLSYKPSGTAELSTLFFPQLRQLQLINIATNELVLDAAHYPQLQHLFVDFVRHPSFPTYPTTAPLLQLNLPCLHTLELGHFDMTSADALAACLSATACPRLQHFHATHVCIQPSGYDLILDMPYLQYLELNTVFPKVLKLRAPRLMDLRFKDCTRLKSVMLLPDEDPPLDEVDARAAVAAEDFPATKLYLSGDYGNLAGFGQGHGVDRKQLDRKFHAFEMSRVNVLLYSSKDCMLDDSYQALKDDPRVCELLVGRDEEYDYDDQGVEYD